LKGGSCDCRSCDGWDGSGKLNEGEGRGKVGVCIIVVDIRYM